MPVQTQLQMRRDTAANWTSTNPTLASGEWGLETDTRLMKIGDGATAWNSLGYQLNSLLDEDLATDPNGAYFDGTGLQVYGVANNFASAPDSAALDITGDIDIRVKVALTDWTPSVLNPLLAKWLTTGNQRSYYFFVNTDGKLVLNYSTNGTNSTLIFSTIAPTVSDGSTLWVRATLDVDNGAAGNDVIFYTSTDGSTWTQLGNTVTTAGTITIFSSTATLEIAAAVSSGGSPRASGTIYRAQVLNGIDGTTVFDANFETVPADSFAFTESSANAATVTLTTTRYSFGLPNATFTGTATQTLFTGNDYYSLITVSGKPITIKHLAFEVTTAPASTASAFLAIYQADSQIQPTGAPIYSSSAITVATGAAAIYRVRVTPFVLNPGNYIVAICTTVQFISRNFFGNRSWVSNVLGANSIGLRYATSRTSAAFPTTPVKWSGVAYGNSAKNNFVLLGW